MRLFFSLVFLVIAPFLFGVSPCCAQSINGHMEWRYGEHEAEEDGGTAHDAFWFTQQYSLLYQIDGSLANGRMGRYDLALGGEWNSLDGKVNSRDTDVSSGKILYKGDLVLAPGGLPFKLHVYSHDMIPSTFMVNSPGGLFEKLSSDNFIVGQNVVGLNNGQQIVTGFTLLAGSSSSDYEGGPYYQILAGAPMLLVDYQQYYVRDLKSDSPTHFRDRNLAFVSLNKKDNWFHYRVYDHTDFLNSKENFVERAYILGTIDHSLNRKWVNLANWIKFSADGTYSTTSRLAPGQSAEKRIDLNFFTVAQRKSWDIANFTYVNRTTDSAGIIKDAEFPVYFRFTINPETHLRTRFIAEKESRSFFAENGDVDREVAYLSNRIEAFQRQRWNVNGQIDLEGKGGDDGEGMALRGLFEISSNRSYRPSFDTFVSYSLSYFEGEGETQEETDFWEQKFTGSLETDISSSIRTGLTQTLMYGRGKLDRSVTEYIAPNSSFGLLLSSETNQIRDGETFRSTTSWFGEYRGSDRLSSRLELTYDFLSEQDNSEDVFIASHRLRYDGRSFLVTLRNRLVVGEHQVQDGGIGGSEFSGALSAGSSKSLATYLYAAWMPVRGMEATLRADHEWREFKEGDSEQYFVEQKCRIWIFKNGGFGRQLIQIGEEIEWERIDSSFEDTRESHAFTLFGEFYPTLRTLVGVRFRYRYLKPEEAGTYTGYLTAGVNFQKLQISLDYSYGTREEGKLVSARNEHRWEVRARKIF